MIRTLFISVLLLATLNARENPFFPLVGEKDIPLTSNEDRNKEPLKRAAITLPAQARILQKVTVEFKNLDGSLESKSIELDNYVDWHLPIFISQSYGDTQTEPQTTVKDKKSAPKKRKFKEIASIKYIKLSSSSKSLKIISDDDKLRNFLLVNPHRIVMDFKRDTDIRSYIKKYPKDIFRSVRIGGHKGYYRVVVELDGHYRYSMKKTSDGYLIKLN